MASATPTAVTAADAQPHHPTEDEVKKEMASAGVPDTPGAAGAMSIFVGDHKDVVLLGYYTTLIKMFIGAGKTGDPTICPPQEEVITWLGFAVIVIVYIIRHFVVHREKPGHRLHAVARCVLFATFALCIHSQPISCSLPRPTPGQHASGLTVLHYAQGAIILSLGLVATQAAHQADQAQKAQDSKDEQAAATATVAAATAATAAGDGTDGLELMPLRGNAMTPRPSN